MKIYQFTPNPLKNPQKSKGPEGQGAAGTDFASVLKTASARLSPPAGGAGRIISLENQRARALPSPGDLGKAGRLLELLEADIQAASPATLRSIHNLEGLVYVYAKGV